MTTTVTSTLYTGRIVLSIAVLAFVTGAAVTAVTISLSTPAPGRRTQGSDRFGEAQILEGVESEIGIDKQLKYQKKKPAGAGDRWTPLQ